MPLPEPVPFEGMMAEDLGSPRLGRLFIATLISGGTITRRFNRQLGIEISYHRGGRGDLLHGELGKFASGGLQDIASPPPPRLRLESWLA